MFLAAIIINPPIDRRFWTLPRSSDWFPMAQTSFTDKQLYKNFPVSRETFQYIVSEVEHEILRQDTRFRKAVCRSTKIAILLYFLGSTAEYRTIGNLFGISKPFVSLLYNRRSSGYCKKTEGIFSDCAKRRRCKRRHEHLQGKLGISHMCRSNRRNSCAHPPFYNPTDYVNRKSFRSVVTQAFVDGRYLFQDFVVGWPAWERP